MLSRLVGKHIYISLERDVSRVALPRMIAYQGKQAKPWTVEHCRNPDYQVDVLVNGGVHLRLNTRRRHAIYRADVFSLQTACFFRFHPEAGSNPGFRTGNTQLQPLQHGYVGATGILMRHTARSLDTMGNLIWNIRFICRYRAGPQEIVE